jgi:hypothetical protein
MSTYEQTHQVIIGGDFNEEITNITYLLFFYTSKLVVWDNDQRHLLWRQFSWWQYVVEFMAEHQMSTKEMGPTFINAKGKDCTSIDYILFQESYRDV